MRKLIEGVDYVFNGTFRGHRAEYRLLRAVMVWLAGETFVVPVGFITDFGSVPKWADKWVGIHIRTGSIAFLKHDLAYKTGCVPRRIADLVLLTDLTKSDTTAFERTIIYIAVRFAGRRHYYHGA